MSGLQSEQVCVGVTVFEGSYYNVFSDIFKVFSAHNPI